MSTVVETAELSAPAEKLRGRLERSGLAGKAKVLDLDLPTVEVAPDAWMELARFLRDDPECRFDLLLDISGVDNLRRSGRPTRFESVVHLLSIPRNEHMDHTKCARGFSTSSAAKERIDSSEAPEDATRSLQL